MTFAYAGGYYWLVLKGINSGSSGKKCLFTCSLQQHSTVTIVNKMTAAMIPPVMTTVPAVIRNLLHQQPAYLGEKKQEFFFY